MLVIRHRNEFLAVTGESQTSDSFPVALNTAHFLVGKKVNNEYSTDIIAYCNKASAFTLNH